MSHRKFHGPAAREIRKALGISQADLARRAGISAPHLAQIENGSKQPSEPVAVSLARELNVALHAVTYGEAA